jgi:hypothetical protein
MVLRSLLAATALPWLLLISLTLAGPGRAGGAEQFPSSPNHRGIAPFDPYLVFPENRPGNGVYLNNELIFSAGGRTVLDVLGLPVDGRFIYFSRNGAGAGTLGAYVLPSDAEPRITEVTDGFYHVVLVLGGVVYKKMYRIIDDNVLDLLPSSKTADGPLAGPAGVVFFHVASAVREDANGQATSAFGLKLHLALYGDERTRHLDYLIVNGLPRLKLSWLDETRLEVGLADGRTEVLSTSQFQ